MQLAVLGFVAYLAFRLVQQWRDDELDLSSANPSLLVLAWVVSLLSIAAHGLVWAFVLRRLGAPVPRDALGVFFQGQLGKYLPGGVWHFAGRVGLARARGVPARLTLASIGVEVAASVLAASIVALFVLPLVLAVPLAVVAMFVVTSSQLAPGLSRRVTELVVRLLRLAIPSAAEEFRPALRSLAPATALYIVVSLLYGVAFWLTARALVPVPVSDVMFYAAVFALGWIIGMAVVFAPGGIGVREAVLVAFLAPRVGSAEAILIAGMSRVLLTTADVVAGVGSMGLARLRGVRSRALLERSTS